MGPGLSPADTVDFKMMAHFLRQSLKPGMYISWPRERADELDDRLEFVQILAVDQRTVTADECKPLDGADPDTSALALELSIQPLDRMSPSDWLAATEADVFAFGDEVPTTRQCHFPSANRHEILVWKHEKDSTYDGCINLTSALAIQPSMDLLHASIPVLSLLDALARTGWVGEAKTAIHSSALPGARSFDNRNPLSSRRYMQCLLVIDQLYASGIPELKSGKPQTYYAYVLKFRRLPDGRPMKDLQQEINQHAGANEFDMGPQLPPSLPIAPIRPPPLDAAVLEEIAAGDDDILVPFPISADAVADEPVLPSSPEYAPTEGDAPESDPSEGDAPPQAAAMSESGSEGDSIAASDHGGEVIVPVPSEWPSHIDGFELKLLTGRAGSHHNRSTRLGVHCYCCDLFKTRSTALQTDTLGPKAALWFLGAWLDRVGPGHRDFKPTLADCQAYARRHG